MVHGMDYLLSWNCKHIANAGLRGNIEALCRSAGFEPPVICTPLELIKGEEEPLTDPIVDEIHAIRDAIAKASGNDLGRIAAAARARARQAAGGRRVVKLPAKRTAAAKKAS
jgi:hypothetical protein